MDENKRGGWGQLVPARGHPERGPLKMQDENRGGIVMYEEWQISCHGFSLGSSRGREGVESSAGPWEGQPT